MDIDIPGPRHIKYPLVANTGQLHAIILEFQPGTHHHTAMSISVYTVCPRSSEPFYKVSYYIKWVTTSWTHSTVQPW